MLKRAKMSRENISGVQKFVGVSVALFVATVFRSTTRIMTENGAWILPEWFEEGIGNLLLFGVTFGALLFFVFSAVRSKHIALQAQGSAVAMSEKLLSEESRDVENNVPKAYMI
jgi:hypothetical protein